MRELNTLLNPEQCAKISERMKTFATPNAADVIAEELLKS